MKELLISENFSSKVKSRFSRPIMAGATTVNGGDGGGPTAAARRPIQCLLCGGTHLYPGPRFENHLINEHGAVFDLEFLIKLSILKTDNGCLPKLVQSPGKDAVLRTGVKRSIILRDSMAIKSFSSSRKRDQWGRVLR